MGLRVVLSTLRALCPVAGTLKIEGCRACFKSRQISAVDGVVHGVHLATVTKQGGSVASLAETATTRSATARNRLRAVLVEVIFFACNLKLVGKFYLNSRVAIAKRGTCCCG